MHMDRGSMRYPLHIESLWGLPRKIMLLEGVKSLLPQMMIQRIKRKVLPDEDRCGFDSKVGLSLRS